jgi:hypothetical protein
MDYDIPLDVQHDLPLMVSRRAWAVSQEAWEAGTVRVASGLARVGWHDTSQHPETGAVALVNRDGPLADLVGDLVRIERPMRTSTVSGIVYVIETAALVDDISLSRFAFMRACGVLANEYVEAAVEVVG